MAKENHWIKLCVGFFFLPVLLKNSSIFNPQHSTGITFQKNKTQIGHAL